MRRAADPTRRVDRPPARRVEKTPQTVSAAGEFGIQIRIPAGTFLCAGLLLGSRRVEERNAGAFLPDAAEPVLGLAEGETRGLHPGYGPRQNRTWRSFSGLRVR